VNDEAGDVALRALDELYVQLDHSIRDLHAARTRLEKLALARAAGTSWAQIVLNEDRPLVVELIADVLVDLNEKGSRFRREEALALQREKVSITRISQLFGVSRQRISAILRG
jgi:DNA-directed RNA polymerase sigma subunit (sigma70/sigma32)